MTPLDPVMLIGRTNARPPHVPFGIKAADRFHHLYIIGRTGTGKSNLLACLARQDIDAGHGLAVIDPHGDLAVRLREAVPHHRQNDLVYLDPADPVMGRWLSQSTKCMRNARYSIGENTELWPNFDTNSA